MNMATSGNALASDDKDPDEKGDHDTAVEKVQGDKRCLFFELLPIELRRKIYRFLFRRPLRICPSNVRYIQQYIQGQFVGILCFEYRYYWDGYTQLRGGHAESLMDNPRLPRFNGSPCSFNIFWITMPTPTQSMVIKSASAHIDSDEDILLPSFYDADRGGQVYPRGLRRPGSDIIQIANRANVVTTAIHGVAFLQTCRAAAEEASMVLYGENKFGFDSTINTLNDWHDGANDYDMFDNSPARNIPGRNNDDGTSMTEPQLDEAMKNMFEHDPSFLKQPKFIHSDPFAKFCNKIGAKNVSLVTDIKLDGEFMTAPGHNSGRCVKAAGFATLLPNYTTILHRAFDSLRNVTIHVPKQSKYWDDDENNLSGVSDEDKIDAAIERFVNAMPNIHHLQLGHTLEPGSENILDLGPRTINLGVVMGPEWGKALRFMKIVKDRHDERVRQELLEKEKERTNDVNEG